MRSPLAKEPPGRIDLLITNVLMPGLRGPDLHGQIVELQPEIQVLFMSGYAEGLPEMKLPPAPASCRSHAAFPLYSKTCVSCRPAKNCASPLTILAADHFWRPH
jgi:hypothetical protein